MLSNVIIFICFASELYIAIFGALGLYLNGERGRSLLAGFMIGWALPIGGLIWLALRPSTERQILTQAVELNFIDRRAFNALEKTIETSVPKPKKVKKAKTKK